jgi:hypothetical protein
VASAVHHTRPQDTAVVSWEILDADWEISSPALIDHGGVLLGLDHFETLRSTAVVVLRPYLGTPRAENGIEHSIAHDENVWAELLALGWYAGRGPVAGAGKHWIAGAPPGRSRLVGWDKDGDGPGQTLWQPPSVAHNRAHFDDGTTTLIVRRRTDLEAA